MKTAAKVVAFIALLVLCFLLGFSWQDIHKGKSPSSRALGSLFGVKSGAAATPEEEFQHAYSEIITDYVKPVSKSDLKYAGMEGLMASLGDPHTIFMRPKLAEAFNVTNHVNGVSLNGTFGTGAYPTSPSSAFRQVTAVGDPRGFQFALRLSF